MPCSNDPTPLQLELLALGEPPWLDNWLPDETLFSFVSRHHVWSGSARASDTSQRFFGHSIQGSGHDFPARLGVFVDRTRGLVGDALSVLEARTLLPYYLMFRTQDVREREFTRIQDCGLSGVKARLGLLASRLGAHHPFKVCADCMSEELSLLGVSYWHRDHQLPGVWVCPIHRCALQISEWRSGGAHRHQWALPHHTALFAAQEASAVSQNPNLNALAAFTRFALKHTQGSPIDPIVLARSLISRVRGPSRMTSCRGLDTGKVIQRLSPLFSSLSSIRGNAELAEGHSAKRALMALRKPHLTTHPFWLLALSTVLLDHPEELVSASTPLAVSHVSVATLTKATRQSQRMRLVGLVAQGLSPSHAATEVGVAAGTGLRWTMDAGLTVVRRRGKIRGTTETKLRRLLSNGTSQRDAARATGLSKSAVQDFIQSHRGLSTDWRHAKFVVKQRLQRRLWTKQATVIRTRGVNAARATLPSTYSWLSNNDKEWLVDFNVQHKKVSNKPRPRINWIQRDLDLVQAINQHGSEVTANYGLRGHRDRIFKAVPAAKRQYRNLAHLPESTALLRPNHENVPKYLISKPAKF